MWVDPEAADLVFRSGVPITMIGLDVTHKAILWDEERRAMAAAGGVVSQTVADLLGFFEGFHRRVYGWNGGPIHDAVAVAHLAHPGLVTTVLANVVMELTGEFTRGRTVVDLRHVTDREPNAEVGTDIDRERFIGLLRSAIASFD
jgi:inosine-uridine nucleoside N-ribohydrolase